MSQRVPLLALCAPLVLALGCNSPQGPPLHKIASEINATLAPVDETILPGDTLTVTFLDFIVGDANRPEPPTGKLLVPVDGRLQLPGIGVLRAAGRSPAQLAELIEESYKPSFGGNPPSVAVAFEEQAPRTYHVLGAVRNNGEFPLDPDGRVTLVESLARAGGVAYLGSYTGNVLLVRWDAGRQRQVSWVIDARAKWWDEPETVLLQANDVVYVPQTTIANINDWIDRYLIRMLPFPRFVVPA